MLLLDVDFVVLTNENTEVKHDWGILVRAFWEDGASYVSSCTPLCTVLSKQGIQHLT